MLRTITVPLWAFAGDRETLQRSRLSSAERAMCTKCEELNKRITRYNRLSASINDPTIIDRFNQLVAELEAEKVALHADEMK